MEILTPSTEIKDGKIARFFFRAALSLFFLGGGGGWGVGEGFAVLFYSVQDWSSWVPKYFPG